MKVEKVLPAEQISLTFTGTKDEFHLLKQILGLNVTVPDALTNNHNITRQKLINFMNDLRHQIEEET